MSSVHAVTFGPHQPTLSTSLPRHLARLGMTRDRFDEIWSSLRFSYQPDECPDNMSSEDYRWMLIADFVELFNAHRESFVEPSSEICVDESISRWYGLGGDWINCGLPMYVAIERKPENGAELQTACCGKSGVMLRLKIVKTAKARRQEHDNNNVEDSSLNEGTQVMKELVLPWAKTDRVVVGDSYFASVQAARELYKIGLRFIGVVKTATRDFPYKHLSEHEFSGRGQFTCLVHNGVGVNDPDLLAFAWVDRDRRYFVSTCSNMRMCNPIVRYRMRQLQQDENTAPEKVRLEIAQPNCSALYYSNCGCVDQHNRARQDGLKLETKYGTHDWSHRVNLSLLSMCVVDAFYVYRGCRENEETFNEFVHKMADEMIEYGLTTRYQRATANFGFGSNAESSKRARSAIV